MALQIFKSNSVFHLTGKINTGTSSEMFHHLISILMETGELNINIDEVIEIDTNGLSVLVQLNDYALSNRFKFGITGYGCKDIYDHFKYQKVA